MAQNSNNPVITDPVLKRDEASLEGLVRDLSAESGTPEALMREHLDAARFYMVGAMPKEYSLSLSLAKEQLATIKNDDLQARIADFLRNQESRAA